MRSTGKITFQRELRDKRSGIKKEVRGPQKSMENQKGSSDNRKKKSTTQTLAPRVWEGKMRPHRQGQPGSHGDNTLGFLDVGGTHNSLRSHMQWGTCCDRESSCMADQHWRRSPFW
jgi:hypothetical protein